VRPMQRVLSRTSRYACGALAVAVLACAAPNGYAQAAAPQVPPPSQDSGGGAGRVTLEFDVAPDMLTRDANGRFRVTAFQVGFFDERARLVRALEIPRADATIDSTKVRLQVPLITVQRNEPSRMTIRVRPLSSGALAPWSAPAGSVNLPQVAAADRRGRDRAAGKAGGPAATGEAKLTPADLERYPTLKAAVSEMLDGKLSYAEAVASFSRVQELALAVVMSRKHDVPLPRICAAMLDGSPSFPEALRRVKSSINPAQELRGARSEARALLKKAKIERRR
jgi:hypothetical protein